MKHCINPACTAELDDYVERCPECGVAQKRITSISKSPIPTKQPTNRRVERHGFITFWLYLTAIANFIMAIIQLLPKQSYGQLFPDKYVGISIFCGILSILCIVGIVMLLNWRKLGFYIILFSGIIGNLLSLWTMRSFPYGLISIFILWLVLQIKKNNISYWNALQ